MLHILLPLRHPWRGSHDQGSAIIDSDPGAMVVVEVRVRVVVAVVVEVRVGTGIWTFRFRKL